MEKEQLNTGRLRSRSGQATLQPMTLCHDIYVIMDRPRQDSGRASRDLVETESQMVHMPNGKSLRYQMSRSKVFGYRRWFIDLRVSNLLIPCNNYVYIK